MSNRIEQIVADILQAEGLERQTDTEFDEIGNGRIWVYQFPSSTAEYQLEVQTVDYRRRAQNAIDDANSTELFFAVHLNIYIAWMANGQRTLVSAGFLQLADSSDDEQQLREQIRELLRMPLATYHNAICPMGKFVRINVEQLFCCLKPKDVANLERACNLFYNLSRSAAVDGTFWKLHFTKEYPDGTNATDQQKQQQPVCGYRQRYVRNKNAEKHSRSNQPVGGGVFMPPNFPSGGIPFPRAPNNPLQPLNPRPGTRQPTFPPFIGDVDNPANWLPGGWRDNDGTGRGGGFGLPSRFAPQGDPPEYLPNNPLRVRGLDPDMPIGPQRRGGPHGGDPLNRFRPGGSGGAGGSGFGFGFGGGRGGGGRFI